MSYAMWKFKLPGIAHPSVHLIPTPGILLFELMIEWVPYKSYNLYGSALQDDRPLETSFGPVIFLNWLELQKTGDFQWK